MSECVCHLEPGVRLGTDLQKDSRMLELNFGGQVARLLVRGLTVWVYFGTRGFVWKVGEL